MIRSLLIVTILHIPIIMAACQGVRPVKPADAGASPASHPASNPASHPASASSDAGVINASAADLGAVSVPPTPPSDDAAGAVSK